MIQPDTESHKFQVEFILCIPLPEIEVVSGIVRPSMGKEYAGPPLTLLASYSGGLI